MAHPIYDYAAKENAAIEAEFLASPMADRWRAYQRNAKTMAAYADAAPTANSPSPAPRAASKLLKLVPESQRVITEAEKYLGEVGKRQTSGEITKVLLTRGVKIGGDDFAAQSSRVSAHLSVAKTKFDNDRAAGGYGLKGKS